jgi:hypothetical protein
VPGATLYPFVVSTLSWESRPGQWNLTICLKATYSLAPGAGEPALASQQDGSHEDVPFEQAPRASLYSPSDFVPFKGRADILLVGQANAPGGAPVDSLVVRLRLGDFSKALWVTGDRAWVGTAQGPRASAPRPFTRIPLRYERASRKGDNAAGIAAGDPSCPPPNIDLSLEGGPAETPGFGPIAPTWRAQRDPRIREALLWGQRIRTSPQQGPAPAGIEAGVFNSAPSDQQVAEIAPGAPLLLDNLHPRSPLLSVRMPTVTPKVFHVDPTTGQRREVPFRIDTLWIDTDREVFVVSWRGVIGIASPAVAGIGRVLVAGHPQGQTVTFEEVEGVIRAGSTGAPFTLAPPASTPQVAAAPIAGAPWAGVPATPVPKPSNLIEGTLPLGASLVHLIKPAPSVESSGPAGRKAYSTTVLQQMPAQPAAAPFPLAEPGARASSAPVVGAPWAGVAAPPVPRPDEHLQGTLPLGASLVEIVEKVEAKAAEGPVPPATVAPPAVVAPPAAVAAPEATPPVVEPPPAAAPSPPTPPPAAPPVQVAWRVDGPEPAPEPPPRPVAPAAPAGPDVKKQMYGEFTRKR